MHQRSAETAPAKSLDCEAKKTKLPFAVPTQRANDAACPARWISTVDAWTAPANELSPAKDLAPDKDPALSKDNRGLASSKSDRLMVKIQTAFARTTTDTNHRDDRSESKRHGQRLRTPYKSEPVFARLA
jgi:hypothetical protein